MSLLLDALKQAEENKNKGLTQEEAVVTESVQAIEPTLVLESQPAMPIDETIGSNEKRVVHPQVDAAQASVASSLDRRLDSSLNVFSAGGKRQNSQTKKHVIVGLVLLLLSAAAAYWVMSEQSMQPAIEESSLVEGDDESTEPSAVDLIANSEPSNINSEVKIVPVEHAVVAVKTVRDIESINTNEKRSTDISIRKSSMSASLSMALNNGYTALQNGRYSEATLTYEAILKKKPKQIDALLGLANIYAHNGDLLAARRQYDKALIIRPSNKIAQIGLLYTYQTDNSAKGLELLQNLSVKYPNNPEILVAIGHKLAKQSKWFAAQQAYFKAYSAQPNNTLLAYNLAVSLDRMGKYSAASNFYKKALALNSASSPVINSRQIKSRLLEIGENR